jgi:spermidine/putrescine transport system substrate-binding protein
MTDYPDLCKSEYKNKTSVRLKRPTLLAFAFAASSPFALYGDPKAYSALMDNVGKTLAACKEPEVLLGQQGPATQACAPAKSSA